MRLLLKLAGVLIAIAFITTVLTFYITWTFSAKTLQTQAEETLKELADNTMNKIDIFMFERATDIKVIAEDDVISSRYSSPRNITKSLVNFRNLCKAYVSLSFFDSNRVRIADTAGLELGNPDNTHSHWADVLAGKISVGSEIGLSGSLEMPVIYFSSPVRDRNNEIFGVVVARVPLDSLNTIMGEISFLKQKKNVLFVDLADKNGRLIYSSYNRKGILKDRLTGCRTSKSKIGSGVTAMTYDHRYEGDDTITVLCREGGYRDFEGNGWVLAIHIPKNVVFAPIRELRNKWILVTAFFFVLGVTVSLFFAYRLSAPITKLKSAVEDVGRGKLDTNLDVRSGDEIGELAAMFNKMTKDLEISQRKLKEYSGGLESKVAERTAELNSHLAELKDSREVMLSILEDTTDVKNRLEETLKQLKLTEEDLIRSGKLSGIGQMAAGVAHEIN
ncbi:MAG: HAMP domain-containing protein, partial [Candidatus Omnitrophica bacterium]|nr:HAMP domain-containing protein [Candidatus Omnitrophota bacterium]